MVPASIFGSCCIQFDRDNATPQVGLARLRKTNSKINHSVDHQVTSQPTANADASTSMHQESELVPGKIDESKLTFDEPR
jgi:hypothetical protein